MHTKPLFFLESIRLHRGMLAVLFGLEALRALLLAGAAYAASLAVDGVFLRKNGLYEIAPVLLVLFLLLAMQPLVHLWQNRIAHAFAAETRARVRERLHARLLGGAPAAWQLLPLALEQADALGLWFTRVLPVLLGLVVSLPLLLLIAAATDPWAGLLMLVTVPIVPFLLYLIGRVTREASVREWQKLGALSAGFTELLQALPTLKLFGQAARMGGRVRQLSEDFAAAALRVLQLSFVSAFALELITTLSIAMIAVSIGLRLLYGHLSFPTAFFTLLLAPAFYQPLRQSGAAFHSGMTAMTAEQALRAAQNAKSSPAPVDSLFPRPAPSSPQADSPCGTARRNAALTAAHLSFSYPGSPLPTIQEVSFFVPQGGITVILGPSGSGKTTLLKLAAGLLTPSSGNLYWTEAGRVLSRAALCQRLSYVPQEPHLFNASLAENVCLDFHAERVTAQKTRIDAALRQAGLSTFLHALPQGLSTRLGEGGQGLSQGQRKRLGLARALYQDRPFVLLDEPTAALDKPTAALIRAILQALATKRTLLIVTHDEAIRACAQQVLLLHPSERPENGEASLSAKRKAPTDNQRKEGGKPQ